MNTQGETTRLVLNRILHPSDFSQASEVAFAHALKLALLARAALRLWESLRTYAARRPVSCTHRSGSRGERYARRDPV